VIIEGTVTATFTRPNLARERALVLSLCRHFNIKVGRTERVKDEHRPWDWYAWSYDGKVLDVDTRFSGEMGDDPFSDSMHDIAHWLCASKQRRKLPEFGLGTSVDSRSRRAPWAVRPGYALDEEALASLLGILMERASRMGDWESTYRHHSWYDRKLAEVIGIRRSLKRYLARRGLCLKEILDAVCLLAKDAAYCRHG
jgi:hypothetical protein